MDYGIFRLGPTLSTVWGLAASWCSLRACDMNVCCILGPSESPEAAVGRSQV